MISKVAGIALGLVLAGSSVFAQSLADAKRAIDAEKYQKAKSMLKNLTVTQPTNDENFFYLGWVYLIQDYTDSAKTSFMNGIAKNPKSAINYAGLGVVSHLTNDAAGKTFNFGKVAELTGKKDSKPWLYMGQGLLMPLPGNKVANTADVEAARVALEKAKVANPKDVDVLIQLGHAYTAQKNTGEAYKNYNEALAIDPKSPAANVAQGIQWKNAHSFDSAIEQFKKAIEFDPNYGPAYREWAETELLSSFENKATASVMIQDGVVNYSKYLSLTDESEENLMRYADFLISAGRYPELQAVADKLSKSASANPRIYRYLAYAAFENKDYAKGMAAIRNFFSKAEPKRVIPRDYFYQGRLQLTAEKDTVGGLATLRKAADLDSTIAEPAYKEIIDINKARKDWLSTAKAYEGLIERMRNRAPIANYIYQGIYYYNSFNSKNPDSTLLVKADSAFSRGNQRLVAAGGKPNGDALIYRGRIANTKESNDPTALQGYAKQYYDKYIELYGAAINPATASRTEKIYVPEAYAYLARYALYHDKNEVEAEKFYTKAKEFDPNNAGADWFFNTYKKAPASTPKKPTK